MKAETRGRTLATKFLSLTDSVASTRILGDNRQVQLSQRRLDAFTKRLSPDDRKELLKWLDRTQPADSAVEILMQGAKL